MAIVLDGTTGIDTPAINAGNIVGEVCFFGMSTAPTGFLKANGAAVSRTTYANLFAAIGTTFGAGDGSTTFALPDMRGEFPRGWDDGRGVDSGRVFGSAQDNSVGPHDHNTRAGFASVSDFYGGSGVAYGTNSNNLPVDTSGSTATTGPGIGTETRPRNVALLACIKF
jgi:microcystin-dependent protein